MPCFQFLPLVRETGNFSTLAWKHEGNFMKLAELRTLAEAKIDGNQLRNRWKQRRREAETQVPDQRQADFLDETRPTLGELEAEAGEDWPLIKDDRQGLLAFRQALITRRMIERGEIPASYTASTNCNHCGSVPIFEGCPPDVLGFPWCFNRIRGVPIPRAKQGQQP